MNDEELEALRREMQRRLDYSGYIDDKSEDEYAREGARTVIALIDEMKGREQEAGGQERERILRWLRVAYQWSAPYCSLADAIERREYEQPYSPPLGLVDDRPAMTAEQYDEKRRRVLRKKER